MPERMVRAKRQILRLIVALILLCVAVFCKDIRALIDSAEDKVDSKIIAIYFQSMDKKELEDLIDAHIHNPAYRDIVKDRLIDELKYSEIETKRGYCDRHLKRIVYNSEKEMYALIAK